MAVNYTAPAPDSLLPVPGIRLGTAAAHVKNWQRDDVVLIDAAPGTIAAGVFTQNAFCAAPVTVSRRHLAQQRAQHLDFRALVVNAGNANAGTGDAGIAAAEATCVRAAQLAHCAPAQVLAFSTGVIM
jgi:glutamate N-acetyltransferase/amino-acid N-acetyltransferase